MPPATVAMFIGLAALAGAWLSWCASSRRAAIPAPLCCSDECKGSPAFCGVSASRLRDEPSLNRRRSGC